MLLRLLILLFSPLLFWSDGGLSTKNNAEPTNQNQKTTQRGTPQYKAEKDSFQTLKLMFAGDVMSQLSQIEAAEIGGGRYDYTPCFQYIKPILETADVAIGNLECTLPGHPPYTGYPCFKSPEQLAKALKINGFDLLVTANNHALDAGLNGLNHTNKTVRDAGFLQTGTFPNSDKKRLLYPLIFYKNGFKIALLNYTHHTNSIPIPAPSIVNKLDLKQIKTDIAEARRMKPDLIITFLHWGIEYDLNENSDQREVAKQIHIAGSHLVIGGHPHVVQPIKNEHITLSGKTYDFLTAYSLGNFISSQPYPNTEGGIIFEVNLRKEKGRVLLDDYHYIPVLRYTPFEQGKLKYYVLPISPFEGNPDLLKMPNDEREKMTAFAAKMRKHLERFGVTEHKFDKTTYPQVFTD
jgi:poly-gamma-glutamate capsule biosynthesis protein CapA/YwtB (metallophosphatase superfamily)